MSLKVVAKVLSIVALALAGSAYGCAADPSGGSESALVGNADAPFRPLTGCTKKDYVGEIDFTDRRHPRYRIRHSDASRGAEVGKQNIGLILELGNTLPRRAWLSDDSLVSVYSDMHTPELKAESDRAIAWRDLPVTDEFLALAFDDAGVHLERAEIIFNVPNTLDPFCRASFVDE